MQTVVTSAGGDASVVLSNLTPGYTYQVDFRTSGVTTGSLALWQGPTKAFPSVQVHNATGTALGYDLSSVTQGSGQFVANSRDLNIDVSGAGATKTIAWTITRVK